MKQKNIQWAWQQTPRCASMKFLLVVLACEADDQGVIESPTILALSQTTGMHRKTVIKYKKHLLADGFISEQAGAESRLILSRGEQ